MAVIPIKDYDFAALSIVPHNLYDNDPRMFAVKYRRTIRRDNQSFVAFFKKLQTFEHYNRIRIFEEFAHSQFRLLVPADVFRWRKRAAYKKEHRHARIGQKHFYLVEPSLLTPAEWEKYNAHVADAQQIYNKKGEKRA